MKNTLIDYNKNCEPLDGKFIRKFIELFVKANKLENYYNGAIIDFFNEEVASYNTNNEIIINTDLIVKKLTNEVNINVFDLSEKKITEINHYIIKTIYHELTHVMQNKIINTEESLRSYIFKNSLNQIKKNINKYYTYYKYFPVEWNANIEAEINYKKFFNLNNTNLKTWYDFGYKESDGKIISPIEYYYYYTNQEFYQLKNDFKEDIINLENIEAFKLGFNLKTTQKIHK